MILTAEDFMDEPREGHYFHFSVTDRDRVISALRKLIEGLEDGRVVSQRITITTTSSVQEYMRHEFKFEYAESHAPEAARKPPPPLPPGTDISKEERTAEVTGRHGLPHEVRKI